MCGSNLSRICGLLLGALLLAGCSRQAPPPVESILRVSQRNEPGDLDPAKANLPDELFILRALSEGLVTPNPEGGAPLPAAARSWTVSEDGLVYIFILRPNGSWSNGEPVTADDFVASYHRVLRPGTAAPKASLLFMVRGAEDFYRGEITDFGQVGFRAIDRATLQITLKQPAPQFLAYVSSTPWLPINPRVVERYGAQWTRPENFVGNGPFSLSEWKPNQHISVRKRPDYWDAARVEVDGIRFQAFDSGDAEERAYRAGQLDVTMSVPNSKILGYADQQPSPLRQIPLYETRFLAFNVERPPLSDIRVRRALALAIDREAIVSQVLRGGQQAAYNFVPEGLGGFHPGETLHEDVDEARGLLAKAGYPNGIGFPVLELTGWSQTPVLEAVQAMWKRNLGISIHIRVRDAKVHVAALTGGDFDIGFITAIPDVADPAIMLGDLRSGASSNYSHWSHPEFDRLLKLADRQIDSTLQLRLLMAADELISAQCPVSPLYFNTKNMLLRPTVVGWREDALWNRFYKGVSVQTGP
jgi:oligopeptide transport system substrate-binding protein